jgi:ankyrin repeat protein/cytochrome c-type biogenesis protein CcmH/NrfG
MSRRLILLAVLILAGAAAGGYKYVQWREETERAEKLAKSVRAQEAWKQKREQMLKDQEKLVSQAREWLDEYSGQDRELLLKASDNLERVLKVNEGHVAARIERARLYIKAGHINYRNFQPGTLQRAERDLRVALTVNPKSADAYILLGNVFLWAYAPKEALTALETAEKIGTDNPWLHINWADALMDLDRWDEAEARLRKALEQYGTMAAPPKRVVRSVHEKLASVYTRQRKFEDADKEYQAAIAMDPTYAWGRGNYADFLLFRRGMPDAAIAEAEKTIEIMDYGMVRMTLAAARYAKWAELKGKAPAEAAKYLALAEAQTRDFSWVMPQSAKSVSAGPVIQNMVRALMARGVSIDTKDENGDTGLTLAADLGDVESVVILIKLGANTNAQDKPGQTALAIAASKGYIELAKALGARGAKVDSRDQVGRTPFFVAAYKGNKEMMRTLIAMKADINMPTNRGDTPLMSAAFNGNAELVRFLLEVGADPSRTMQVKDAPQTAADIAASAGHQELAAEIRAAAEKRKTARR